MKSRKTPENEDKRKDSLLVANITARVYVVVIIGGVSNGTGRPVDAKGAPGDLPFGSVARLDPLVRHDHALAPHPAQLWCVREGAAKPKPDGGNTLRRNNIQVHPKMRIK